MNMKKYAGNMKKYVENKDSPYIWAVAELAPLSIGQARGGGGSQFPGLGVPQKKDMKYVKTKI